MPAANFLCSHVLRALLNQSYETYEITGPQMVLTMKLTTFAWNVYDGRRSKEVRFHPTLITLALHSNRNSTSISSRSELLNTLRSSLS